MNFIVLTPAKHTEITGDEDIGSMISTGAKTAVAPRLRADGETWVLKASLVSDPAHSDTLSPLYGEQTISIDPEQEWPVE